MPIDVNTYLEVSIDEIMDLGRQSDATISTLFLQKIDPSKVWKNDQFLYSMIGPTVNQNILFGVQGTLINKPRKKSVSKKTTAKKVTSKKATAKKVTSKKTSSKKNANKGAK